MEKFMNVLKANKVQIIKVGSVVLLAVVGAVVAVVVIKQSGLLDDGMELAVEELSVEE
jgi:hypothetical protein